MPVIQTSAGSGTVLTQSPAIGKPMRLATASMCPRRSGLGKGMWLKVRVALQRSLPPTFTFASVMA